MTAPRPLSIICCCAVLCPVAVPQIPTAKCPELEGGVVYKGGLVETSHDAKSTDCCSHCCEAKPSGADAWCWTPDGTCQCHDREHIVQTPVVGGNSRAGHCVHRKGDAPFVPDDLDRAKWLTAGDQTTRKDVERTAARNETGSTRYVFVTCGSCGNWDVTDPSSAHFCQADFAGGNFSVRVVEYEPGGYCTDPYPATKETTESYTVGEEHGTYIGVDGPEACSAEAPPRKCLSHNSRYRHCDCDPVTCTGGVSGCCTWAPNETLSAVFTYWTVETKNSSAQIVSKKASFIQ
eukprot:COSAG01_NODE_7734_length_3080_cov_2.450855_2_plen_291_part_00